MSEIKVKAGGASFLLSVAAAFVLGACGGGGGTATTSSSGGSSSSSGSISGTAVNAPFLTATVTCGKLESDGTFATTTVTGSLTTDTSGAYTCNTTWTGATVVTVVGTYINWATRTLDSNTISAVVNSAGGTTTANVTTLTTIATDAIVDEYANQAATGASPDISTIVNTVDTVVIQSVFGSDWQLPSGTVLSDLNPMATSSTNNSRSWFNRRLLQFDMDIDTRGNARSDLASIRGQMVGRTAPTTITEVTSINAVAANMSSLISASSFASAGLPTTSASDFATVLRNTAADTGTVISVAPSLTASGNFTTSGNPIRLAVKQLNAASWGSSDQGSSQITLSYSLLNTSHSGQVTFSLASGSTGLTSGAVTAGGSSTATGSYSSLTGTSNFVRVTYTANTATQEQTVRIIATNATTGLSKSLDVAYTALAGNKYPWAKGGSWTTTGSRLLYITLSGGITDANTSDRLTYYIADPFLVAPATANNVKDESISYTPLAGWTPTLGQGARSGPYGSFFNPNSWYNGSAMHEGITTAGGMTWSGQVSNLISAVSQFSADGGFTPAGALAHLGQFTSTANHQYYLSVTAGNDLRVYNPEGGNASPVLGGSLSLSNGIVTFSPLSGFTPSAPIGFLYAVKDHKGYGKFNKIEILVLDSADSWWAHAYGENSWSQ